MSVMTRNPDGTLNMPGSPTGRPLGPMVEQAQPSRPQLQRQAVIDQLGTEPTQPAALPGSQAVAGNAGTFARGGHVKQLPGMDTGKLLSSGVSTGANVAGKIAGNTAAGAATGMGISMGTDYLGGKLKPKEDMPDFGGEFGDLTDSYGRRFEGAGPGVAGGAVRGAGYGANPGLVAATGGLSVVAGAGIGALIGAITKNAKTAFSDFRVEDAAQIVKDAYKKYLGREASDEEVQGQLIGQGWDPKGGDRWVGEQGLRGDGGVLSQIRDSPEAQAFRARGSVIDQLGTGGEPIATNDIQSRTGAMSDAAGGSAKQALPGAAASDPSGWNTDGFAAPQVTAQGFREQAPPGWDQKKWSDPTHQTPKYVWGRLSQDDNPDDVNQLLAAYPGSTFNGKDKVTIPGVGTIDIFKGASVGLNEPQWLPEGGSASASAPTASVSGGAVDIGARPQQPDVLDKDTLAKLRAELERIMSGQPDRQALLAQMGGANG